MKENKNIVVLLYSPLLTKYLSDFFISYLCFPVQKNDITNQSNRRELNGPRQRKPSNLSRSTHLYDWFSQLLKEPISKIAFIMKTANIPNYLLWCLGNSDSVTNRLNKVLFKPTLRHCVVKT